MDFNARMTALCDALDCSPKEAPARAEDWMKELREALEERILAGDKNGARTAVEASAAQLLRRGFSAEADAWLDEVEARAFSAPAGSDEATTLAEALEHVAKAPWFPSALPSADRRRAEMVLHAAAMVGDAAEVRRRLAAGVNGSARHLGFLGMPTALLAASYHGYVDVVQALLRARVSASACALQGRTALHLAADQDHAAIVALLCSAGAPRDAQDVKGRTALHLAAWQGHLASVEALVLAGAALEVRDRNGDTALSLSATEPVPAVVRRLVAASADIEAKNALGQTPLLRAAIERQEEVIEALLEAGAAIPSCDRRGRSALDWASAAGGALPERDGRRRSRDRSTSRLPGRLESRITPVRWLGLGGEPYVSRSSWVARMSRTPTAP
ncbi:MAG TPA: ankyrin repeat domain-containing protein [Polyangiaceae bacterium]|nr:ankyrin repeat domain-containing protein [Polyangiaceae bacterium]